MGLRIAGTAFAQRTARNMVAAQAAPLSQYPPNAYAYIYTLSDPRTGKVRYVGKTFNPQGRLYDHCKAQGSTHKACWIKALKAAGLAPDMDIVDMVAADQEQAFFDAESRWIETFRLMGYKLTNLASGGGSGSRHSQETIEKMRFAQNNRSEETKARNAAVAAARKGRKHSPESIAKMRASHAFVSEETRRKASISHSRISEASRAKMSEGQKRRFQDKAQRLLCGRAADSNRGKKRTSEQCARIAAGIRAARARKLILEVTA